MSAVNTIEVILKASSGQATSEIKKVDAALGTTKGGLKGLSDSFQNITGISLGAAAAFGAITAALKFVIDNASEAQKVDAQLAAVIKSTGMAAGLSADEIDSMATEMSRLTGFEDEAIKRSAALMLTFTRIGKQVFPDALMAAQNMSAALGQDLQSSVIQLGKALNDPIQGVTALRRVGVSFTESQLEMIKGMVKAGDVMGAQKYILQELETEFGGAAEAAGQTFAGELSKARNELGNVAEVIGMELLPALTELMRTLGGGAMAWQKLKEGIDAGVVSTWEANWTMSAMIFQLKDSADVIAEVDKRMAKQTVTTEDLGESFEWVENRATAMTEQFYETAEGTDQLKQEEEDLKQALDDLQMIIKGPIGEALEDFKTKSDELKGKSEDLRSKLEELRSKIEELEAREYLTEEQQGELDNLKSEMGNVQTELGKTEGALDNLAAKHEETTSRILFGILEQKLAIGGWSDEEIELLTEVGRRWGLYDEATAEAMMDVQEAVDKFNASGSLDETAGDLDTIKQKLESIPKAYDIEVKIHEQYIPDPNNPHNYYGGGRQHGGPVMAGVPYMVGEAGPEIFVPQQTGAIMPNNQISLFGPDRLTAPAVAEMAAAAAGASIAIEGGIHFNVPQGMNGRQLFDEFMDEISRQTRQSTLSGAWSVGGG